MSLRWFRDSWLDICAWRVGQEFSASIFWFLVQLILTILVNVDYGRAISIKNFIATLPKRSGRGTEQFSNSEIAQCRRQSSSQGRSLGRENHSG